MKGVEEVKSAQKLIAIIFPKNIKFEGVKFFTDELNPFQIGIHHQRAGIQLAPHIHKLKKPHVIKNIQELLFVQSGKIRVSLYSKRGKIIATKMLNAGDSVLFLEGGHGVEFLEDSRVFMVKQGPFTGTVHAKIYLK